MNFNKALTVGEQKALRLYPELFESVKPAYRKGVLRIIIQHIVDDLFSLSNSPASSFPKKVAALIKEGRIKEIHEPALLFIWNEASKTGTHGSNNNPDFEGEDSYLESIIICANAFIKWHFAKKGIDISSLQIEQKTNNYMIGIFGRVNSISSKPKSLLTLIPISFLTGCLFMFFSLPFFQKKTALEDTDSTPFQNVNLSHKKINSIDTNNIELSKENQVLHSIEESKQVKKSPSKNGGINIENLGAIKNVTNIEKTDDVTID